MQATGASHSSLINSTMLLRHLHLAGEYLADQALRLPSMFVLKLQGIRPAANLSTYNTSKYAAWSRWYTSISHRSSAARLMVSFRAKT